MILHYCVKGLKGCGLNACGWGKRSVVGSYAHGNEISGKKGGGNGLGDRVCVMEFGSENFINLNQSGQIAASRTICGLAVDILCPLNTRTVIAATGQALREVQDRPHFYCRLCECNNIPSMTPPLAHIIHHYGRCKSPEVTDVRGWWPYFKSAVCEL
jgi:hypothetical protein